MIDQYVIENMNKMIIPVAKENLEKSEYDKVSLTESYTKILEEAENANPALTRLSIELTDFLTAWHFLKSEYKLRDFLNLEYFERKKLLDEKLEEIKDKSRKSFRIMNLRREVHEKYGI